MSVPHRLGRNPAFLTRSQLLVGKVEEREDPTLQTYVTVRPVKVRPLHLADALVEPETTAQADAGWTDRPDLPGAIRVAYRGAKRNLRCVCNLQSRSPFQRG